MGEVYGCYADHVRRRDPPRSIALTGGHHFAGRYGAIARAVLDNLPR